MGYKTRSVYLDDSNKHNYKTRSVYLGKTYSNKGGIGEGLGYIAGNIGIGAAGIIEGVTDLVSAAGLAITGHGDEAKEQFINSWSADWKRQLDDWYNPNATMSFLGDVGSGLGNSLVAALPYVGLPIFFAGAAGGGIGSASQKTGDVGFKEVGYGLTSGMVEGMLEKYVGPGAAKAKGIGTKAISSLTKSTAKSGVRNSVWKSVLSNMGEEFLEESTSEIIDPLLQKMYQIDPQASTSFPAVLRAGIIGGISGGILGGAQIGLSASRDKSIGKGVADAGNSQTVAHAAEQVLSSPFFANEADIRDDGILELAGTLNSYKALTPEQLTSGEGYRLLGAMKRQLFTIEVRSKSAPYRNELLNNAEKTAAYASDFFGRKYTAEDIKANKDGILTYLTVIKWAGDAEIKERAKAQASAAMAAAMEEGGVTDGSDVMAEAASSEAMASASAGVSAPSVITEPAAAPSPTVIDPAAAVASPVSASANSQTLGNMAIEGQENTVADGAEGVTEHRTPSARESYRDKLVTLAEVRSSSAEAILKRVGSYDEYVQVVENYLKAWQAEYNSLPEGDPRRAELIKERDGIVAEQREIIRAIDEQTKGEENEAETVRHNLEEEIWENKLVSYSQNQVENWKNSKSIIIYENEKALRKFIEKSLSDAGYNKKMYFGMIGNDLAREIEKAVGLDLEGFNCSLKSFEVRKILKDHGNAKKEERRGQRAVSVDDFIQIPNVVSNSDKITLSPKLYEGKPVIEFTKKIKNEKTTVVAVVSDKHMDLFVQTEYIGIKKGNLATPKGDQAPFNTPEANNGTVSNIIIHDKGKKVNSFDEKNPERQNLAEEETEADREAEEIREERAAALRADGIGDGAESSADADTEIIETDERTKRMIGSYPETVVSKARKYVKGFDMLSYERKVAVCELIESSPNMGQKELRAMSVLVSQRDGLFAYSSPTKHKGVYKVLNRLEGLRLIVLSDHEKFKGEGMESVIGETIFHELAHDIKAANGEAFKKVADAALRYISKEERDATVDRYTEHYTGEAYSDWVKENPGKDIGDFLRAHPKSSLSEDILAEEIVTKWIGKAFGHTRYLKYLADTQPKVFKGVCRGFNTLFRCLFGKNKNAERALLDVYVHFHNALRDTQVGELFKKSTEVYTRYEEGKEEEVRYSLEEFPIDNKIADVVKQAEKTNKSEMHELCEITKEQNKAINGLVNQARNNLYRGKFTGGRHLFSDTAVRHILSEHGDFLREGLRAQLPMTEEDIARHLSAVKDNKKPSSISPTMTNRGNASIVTSYKVNGYTLYAEEIIKTLGDKPSNLIGHTMYKAPTLATAAATATSAVTLPKRQNPVLWDYYTTSKGDLSRGKFVSDKENKPSLLNYVVDGNVPKSDQIHGALIALSADKSNFTDKSGKIEQGYVRCNKPFYITADNRVFSNSETNVSEKINELKRQGYDCFIFDNKLGDNYMVAVVNKAQIVKEGDLVQQRYNLDGIDDGTRYSLDYEAATMDELRSELRDRGVSASAANDAADELIKKHFKRTLDSHPTRVEFKKALLRLFISHASAENSAVRYKTAKDGRIHASSAEHHSTKAYKRYEAQLELLARELPDRDIDGIAVKKLADAQKLVRGKRLYVSEELKQELIKAHEGKSYKDIRKIYSKLNLTSEREGASDIYDVYNELHDAYPDMVPDTASESGEITALRKLQRLLELKAEELVNTPDEKIAAAREEFKADAKAYAEGLSSALGEAAKELKDEQRIHGYQESIMRHARELNEMVKDKRVGAKEADTLVKALIARMTASNPEAREIGDFAYVDINEKALANNIANMEKLINGMLEEFDRAMLAEEGKFSDPEEARAVFNQYFPKELMDNVRMCATRIAANKGARITADEYELVARMMLGIRQWYENYDRVFVEGRYRKIGELLNDYLSGSYEIVRHMGKKKSGKIRELINTIRKSCAIGLLDTRAVWNMFDGYRENGLFTRLWQNLETCMADQAILKEDMLSDFDAFFKKHKKFELELKTRKIKYQGQEINLGEAILLLMTSKREQAFLALYGSDLTVLSLPTTHFKGAGFEGEVTEEQMKAEIRLRMREIQEQIKGDKEVAEYIKLAEDFFNVKSKNIKSKADIDYFGYTNVEDGYYVTINRDKSAFLPDMLSASGQMDAFVSLASLPFNKHIIKNAKAAMVIGNVNDLIRSHADGLSKYATMYQAVEAINRLMRHQFTVTSEKSGDRSIFVSDKGSSSSPESLMKIIADSFWDGNVTKAKKYINNLLNSVQGISQKQYNAAQKIVDYIVRNATFNVLGLNIKSVMSQLSGCALAGYSVNAVNLLKGLAYIARNVKDLKHVGETMDRYSKQAHSRNIDSSGMRSRALMERYAPGTLKVANALNKVSEATMTPIAATDRFTFMIVWAGAQYQVEKSTGYAVGTEENLKAAGKIVDEFATTTQPTVSAANSAAARTDNIFAKTFMRFSSAVNKMFSWMYSSIGGYITLLDAKKNNVGGVTEDEVKRSKSRAVRACGSIIASNIMLVGLIQLFKLAFAKERDEDETVVEDVMKDLTDSFVGLVPIVSQINSFLLDGYEVTDLSFDVVNETLSAIQDVFKVTGNVATGKPVKNTEIARVLRNSVYTTGGLLGIPVRNTWNNLTGLIKRVSPSAGASINSIFRDPTASELTAALNGGDTRLAETIAELMLAKRGGELDHAAALKLLELYQTRDDNGAIDKYGVLPRSVGETVTRDDITYKLDAKQYKKLRSIYTGASAAVAELVGREDFAELSEEAQAKAIKAIYSLYYDRGVSAVITSAEPKKSEIITKFVSDETGYVDALAYASTVSGDDRKAQIIAYLDALGLSEEDKIWVLASLGYNREKKAVAEKINASELSGAEKAIAIEKLGLSA